MWQLQRNFIWNGIKNAVFVVVKIAYCSVDCWSIHDSVMGHKSAYAEEARHLTKIK